MKLSVTSISWKLDPYKVASRIPNFSKKQIPTNRSSKTRDIGALFDIIERGDIEWLRRADLKWLRSVANCSKEVEIPTGRLDSQIQLFYSTLLVDQSNTNLWRMEEFKDVEPNEGRAKAGPPMQNYPAVAEIFDGFHRPELPSHSIHPDLLDFETSSPPVASRDSGHGGTLQEPGLNAALSTPTATPPNAFGNGVDELLATSVEESPQDMVSELHPPVTAPTQSSQLSHTSDRMTMRMFPLTWCLFVYHTKDIDVDVTETLDVLISAGADCKSRDQSGLSAYDHSRILKFNKDTTDRLYPFNKARLRAPYGLLDAIRNCDMRLAGEFLAEKTPSLELDRKNQSPIALATFHAGGDLCSKLLEYGFSPFAIYHDSDLSGRVSDSRVLYYPSMASIILRKDSQTRSNLVAVLWTWIQANKRLKEQTEEDLISTALDIAVKRKLIEGDLLVMAVLFKKKAGVINWVSNIDNHSRGCALFNDEEWAIYAAIRMGNFEFLEQVFRRPNQLTCELDSRHFLASGWPWPCKCRSEVHHLNGRSLAIYVQDLQSSPLCVHCQTKKSSYGRIFEYFKQFPSLQSVLRAS